MKQPKIRFKGFTREWMQTTLGKLTSNFKYGINAAAMPYDGKNKYLRITDIDDATRVFLQENLTTPGADLFYCDDYIMQDGDIVIARTGASVGKSYIYHVNDGRVYFAGFLIRMRLNDDVDKDFIFQNTLTESYANHIKIVSQRSGQPGVNVDELKSYTLSMPLDKDEQQTIGSYFQHLDSLIQSTTKKIESLKQVKAASLQAMFPQEGETTPRVRFKGFEGEWEKVAIKDIASFSKGNGYSKSDLQESGSPIILYGRMYTKYDVCINDVDTFVVPKPNSVYSFGNEVILPASGETPEDISCASAVKKKGIILGGDLNILRFDITNNNTTFIALSLSSGETKQELSNMAQGKSVVHLHNSDIEKVSILMPSYAEQQQIASYFTSLDSQITLHSQRLEKLKQIKSACLDNMFV